MPSPLTDAWTPLTRAYGGVLVARVALFAGRDLWPATPQVAVAQNLAQGAGFVASVVLGLVWLHRAWARVPEPCRRTYDDRHIEPDEAIWKLFIPVYGLFYWMFVATIGLCGAVEHHLKKLRAGSPSAPSTLALIACLAQLVPGVSLVVAPVLWGLFMERVDVAQAEADRLAPHEPAPRPIGAVRVVGIVAGSMVFGWIMLILLFTAIWQLLSPAGPPPYPPH